MTLTKDRQEADMHNYCTRDSSCVGSNIRIGSWSVSIYLLYVIPYVFDGVIYCNSRGLNPTVTKIFVQLSSQLLENELEI